MAKGGGKARGCARELCLLRAVGLFCAIFSFLYGCVVAAASVSAPPRRPPPRRAEGRAGGLRLVLALRPASGETVAECTA